MSPMSAIVTPARYSFPSSTQMEADAGLARVGRAVERVPAVEERRVRAHGVRAPATGRRGSTGSASPGRTARRAARPRGRRRRGRRSGAPKKLCGGIATSGDVVPYALEVCVRAVRRSPSRLLSVVRLARGRAAPPRGSACRRAASSCTRPAGASSTSSTRPRSTIRPSLMTATSCESVRISARLCVTKSSPMSSSRWSSARTSMIAACTETSSAEVTSSQTRSCGSATSARAIADALALAARELVRVAVEARSSRAARDSSASSTRRARLRAADVEEEPERLADDLPDRLPRVERVVRALEDVLDLAPRVRGRARASRARAAVPRYAIAPA